MRSQLQTVAVASRQSMARIRSWSLKLLATLTLGLMQITSFSAAGASVSSHGLEHVEVVVDTTMTLADAVELAVDAYPRMVELSARDDEADAWHVRGRSLIAGRPQLSVRYQTDEFGDDFGLQEIESGVQVPLWNWGQRKSVRDFAVRLDRSGSEMQRAIHWEVAGHMRRLIWRIDLSVGEYGLAVESLAIADRLAAAIRRRYELGDVALGDVLLAESAALEQQSVLIEADAARVDAERLYQSFTGVDRRPAATSEAQSDREEIASTHPLMSFVAAEVAAAEAAASRIRQNALVSPTLLIGPRRERSAFNQSFEDSIGITVTIPFGGSRHVNTQVAAAYRNVASAEAARRQTLRDLDLALHEAEHGLVVARDNLAHANRRVELARRGMDMADLAYESGETGLLELLNLQRMLLDARRQQLRLSVDVYREIAMYNQAVGEAP